MNALTILTLLSLVCSAVIVGLLLWLKRSFGCWTHQIAQESQLTRQSNELTRQSTVRALSEIEANTQENTITHEKTLAVFVEVTNLRRELRDLIDQQRSA